MGPEPQDDVFIGALAVYFKCPAREEEGSPLPNEVASQ